MKYCFDCHEPLMPQEIESHEVRCIECEGELYVRMLNWRNGCEDKELEFMLNVTTGTVH